jgi:hypothetical protein
MKMSLTGLAGGLGLSAPGVMVTVEGIGDWVLVAVGVRVGVVVAAAVGVCVAVGVNVEGDPPPLRTISGR